MIDMSRNENDKKWFVIDVSPDEGFTQYTVTYADNHQESFPFSIHNYNAFLYRMMDQYWSRNDKYKSEIFGRIAYGVRNQLKTIIYSMLGIVFAVSVPLPGIMNMILLLLVLVLNKAFWLKYKLEVEEASEELKKAEKLQKCMQLVDNFKVTVFNPRTNKEETWFLKNPSAFNLDTDLSELQEYSLSLTPEVKDEEGRRISEQFRLMYENNVELEEQGGLKR